MKADFEYVADCIMSCDVSGAAKPHHLLIKRIGEPNDYWNESHYFSD